MSATVKLISRNRKRGLQLFVGTSLLMVLIRSSQGLASGVLAVRCGVGLFAAAVFEGILPMLGQDALAASFVDLDT